MKNDFDSSRLRTTFDASTGVGLEASIANASSYVIIGDVSETAHLALNMLGRPTLIVVGVQGGSVVKTSGFETKKIKNAKLHIHGKESIANILAIESSGSYLEPYYCLCSELSDSILSGSGYHNIDRIISEWVAYFRRIQSLDLQAEIGLWGELAVILKAQDPKVAFECWTGPDGSVNDFTFPAFNLEIKSAVRSRRHFFSNSQLSRINVVPCYIASLLVQENEVHGLSVLDLVEKLSLFVKKEVLIRRLPSADFSQKRYRMQDRILIFESKSLPVIQLPASVISAKFEIDIQLIQTMPLELLPLQLAHISGS